MVLICNIYNVQKWIAKVTLLLSLFCFLLFSNVTAQETHFGVKAGLNYSSIVGDLTTGIKFRFSGHAGIFLDIELTDKFSFKPELLYSSQGFQFSSELQNIQNEEVPSFQGDLRTNVQSNYLIVPLLSKFALSDRLDVEFGPQFGFLLNQTSIIKNLNNTSIDSHTVISGDFQLDYGLVAGISYAVSDRISFEPRVYIGLRNLLNGISSNIQNYNIVFQASVNYALN